MNNLLVIEKKFCKNTIYKLCKNKNCEIAYFGILEEYYGKKYGGFLLSGSIENSFIKGIERVWVHTCSLDHQFALKNYQARGMKIFKSEVVNINVN